MDVTIVHPLQVREMPWSREKAEAFLTQAETGKVNKYREACDLEGWAFVPAAFDTWGGPKAKTVLAKLLQRAVAGVAPELEPIRRLEHRQHLKPAAYAAGLEHAKR